MSSKLVLVLNCGSSSLKFAVIDATSGDEKLSGIAQNVYTSMTPESSGNWMDKGRRIWGAGAAHQEAHDFIVQTILPNKPELVAELGAIGHRVVHGGEKFTQSVVIDEDVDIKVLKIAALAPLHRGSGTFGWDQRCGACIPVIT